MSLSTSSRLPDSRTLAVDLSIVIPAYNEAATIGETLRTVQTYLAQQTFSAEIIVVDDGSTDGTTNVLQALHAANPTVHVLRHDPNQGKGRSIRDGVLQARGRFVIFMDADLSVPIEELGGFFELLSQGEAPIVIGSRRIAGSRIERPQPFLRECLGDGFTWLARTFVCPGIHDFTCGFKGFRRAEARTLFSSQRCDDWVFDVEILYRARLMGMRVTQQPVRWRHQKGSRVRFPRDIYRSLVSLIRVRWRVPRTMFDATPASSVLKSGEGCD